MGQNTETRGSTRSAVVIVIVAGIAVIVAIVAYITITGGRMIRVPYVLIRTHDGPKKHVFPYVYTPYLVLFINLSLIHI